MASEWTQTELLWLRKGEESRFLERVGYLQAETGLSAVTLRICVMRGLDTAQAIQSFLSPRLENLKSPFSLKDMDRAVERLSQAKEAGQAVLIYGDYDVDGTAGAALLAWVFRELGFSFDTRQPDRFTEGYGLNCGAVEEAARAGIQVLVTVDCGITSFSAASKAKELGLDLIVIDHHQVDPVQGLPVAWAVVNPQRPDCESGLKQLCGCGLAFYLSMALRSRGRERGWFKTQPEPNLKQHLDLVVMATAADMVPLVGDNHILVKYGLEVLKHSKKPGVKALLEVAGLASRDVSPSHLGFVLGPRINASGRMDSAKFALELLTTQEVPRATELALILERLNQERATLQNQIWDEVRVRVEKGLAQGRFQHGIVVADSTWHEGVVGIVASRVTETFRKPAVVIALREDFGKGSVRSYGGRDILAVLQRCAQNLLGFGGHKYAAGLSVSLTQLEDFVEKFDAALAHVPAEKNSGTLMIEGDCRICELDVKTLQEIERLGPFGPGNPEPVFAVRAAIKSHRILKGRHLKLSLVSFKEKHKEKHKETPKELDQEKGDVNGKAMSQASELNYDESAPGLEAIWFNGAERSEVMSLAASREEGQWAGVPELNRFRGLTTPTLRVRDWKSLEPSGGIFGGTLAANSENPL